MKNRINAWLEALLGRKNSKQAQAQQTFTVWNREPIAWATTATGAFRALGKMPMAQRADAQIYDENGYCMYR